MSALPSGRQVVLLRHDSVAVVVEVGGGLRSYEVAGEAVLDGYSADERCNGGRGQPLLPWPNRTGGGRYSFAGSDHQLAITEPERGNAIHGLTRWHRWCVVEAEADRVMMADRLFPQPGWDWTLDLSVEYRLGDAGIDVCLTATNRSGEPCPFGAGFHPYLRAPSGRVDDLVVSVPASQHYVSDARGLPTGSAPVEGTPLDFRHGTRIGAAVLDVAFSELYSGCAAGADPSRDDALRTADGRDATAGGRDATAAGRDATAGGSPGDGGTLPVHSAVVEVTDPSRPGWGRWVWMDPSFKVVMLYTGDTLSPSRRRQGLAIEPMTAPADMLRSGDGMRVLAPGEELKARWGITVRRPSVGTQ